MWDKDSPAQQITAPALVFTTSGGLSSVVRGTFQKA